VEVTLGDEGRIRAARGSMLPEGPCKGNILPDPYRASLFSLYLRAILHTPVPPREPGDLAALTMCSFGLVPVAATALSCTLAKS
jgi:hypothetical protein